MNFVVLMSDGEMRYLVRLEIFGVTRTIRVLPSLKDNLDVTM